jgi:anti-sigma B factor antagonist
MAANPAVPAPVLSFQTERTPTETVVRCSGTIVSSTTQSLKTAVRPLLQDSKLVVLDLTGVNYIDSSGLGALVGLYVSAKTAGCRLKLVNLNQRIKELFSITRLAPLFEGHEDMLGMTPD